MKHTNRLWVGAFAVMMFAFMSVPAQAQMSRIYLAGYLGLNVFTGQQFNDNATGNSGEYDLDNAQSFAGALGLRLSHQLRVEGEWSYRTADLSSVNVAGSGTFNTGGELESNMLFANVYYDFDMPTWPVQPFIGGGLGYAWHSGTINDGSGLLSSTSSDDSGLIWNLAAGAKYRVSPQLAFTGGYRYIDSFDLDIGSYEIDYDSHEFRMGLEWDFPIR